MTSASFIFLRRFAGLGLILLLLSFCLSATSAAQTAPPLVTASFATKVVDNFDFQNIWNIAVSSHGDLLVMDFQSGKLYQIPADGRPMIEILTLGATFANPGIAIDSADTLYFGNDWNGGMSRMPYDAVAKTWHASDRTSWAGDAVGSCCNVWWYHPTAIAVNSHGLFVFGIENPSNTIFSMTVDGSGSYSNAAQVATGLAYRPGSIAVDEAGNIYFVEDRDKDKIGVFRIPAGTTGITGESSLARVDTAAGANPVGVAVDPAGNVYISDSKKGVYVVPVENGTPNTSHTYLLTPIAAKATVAVDAARSVLYVPTSRPSPSDPNTQIFNVSKVSFGGDLGTNLVTVNVYYTFAGDVTPASIAFLQGGVPVSFVKVGGDCSTDGSHVYHAGDTCTATLTLEQAGSFSGEVVMLDAQNNALASSSVHGGALGVVKSSFARPTANNAEYQSVWNIAVSSHGDLVVMDFNTGKLYHIPADGRAPITIMTLGATWANPGIAIDSSDALYFGNDWNGGMSRIPYDPVAKTWLASARTSWAGDAVGSCCSVWWYHPTAISVNSHGLFVFGIENPSNTIFSMTVDASGNYTNGAQVATGLAARPKSLAVDDVGNIYFYEDGGSAVYRIPAGTAGISGESSLTRVDTAAGANPVGVAVDPAGNAYISDSTKGVYVVPNESGTPNTSHTYLLTPIAAKATVAIDARHGALYVPITKPSAADPTKNVYDVNKVAFSGDLGTALVGTQGSTVSVYYAFNADVSPASISFIQAGAPADFVQTGGDCSTSGASYHASDKCTATVALQPHAAGVVAGDVAMLDAQNNVLASSYVHGVASGAVAAFLMQPYEAAIGSGLTAPQQVAADALGKIYVADSGGHQVLQYSTSGQASIGTGLTAPTGVAVDGVGNVFIADSGSITMVPYQNGALNAAAQKVILGGLGNSLKLAVDGSGNLGVADPDHQRVLKIMNPGKDVGVFGQQGIAFTGFTQITAIGVDGSGNLLVADGANLIQIAADGTRTTLTDQLVGVNGLAMDVTGSLYVSQADGAFRVPNVGGTLTFSEKLARGTGLTGPVINPTGIALDRFGNLILTNPAYQSLRLVGVGSVLDFGTLKLGDAPTLNLELFNLGNAPMAVAGFTSNNPIDFTATGCDPSAPVAAGASCTVAATMNPGDGEEGPLTGVISVDGVPNAPVYLYVWGTGAALAPSVTHVSVDPKATATNIPVTVTVTPASGSGVPSGRVTLSVDGHAVATTTLSGGSAVINAPPPLTAGTHTFSVAYNGDRTYGRSTATATASLGKGATSLVLPSDLPVYVLSTAGGVIKSDGSADPYYFHLRVHVAAAAGIPTGKISFMEGSSPACGYTDPTDPHISVNVDETGWADWNTNCLSVDQGTQWVLSPLNPHTISAVYTGDGNYAASTSASVSFQALRNPSVAISPSAMAVAVSAGSTASMHLTLTSVGGYGVAGKGAEAHLYDWTGPVELQCNGLPAHTTCSFSPPQVDVNVGAPGTTVLTVNTNVSAGTVTSRRSGSAPVVFAAMFGVGLVGLVFGRKTRYNGRVLMMICALLIIGGAVAGISACGTQNIAKTPQLTTPAGSYSVTVSAKQVFSQNWVSLPYTFTLNVQ